MFRTERGLELLVEATVKLSDQLSELPADILQTLKEGLAVLEDQLWDTSADKDQARLYEVGNWLQARIKSSLAEKHAGEWIIPIQRIGIATHQLTQSVAQINEIQKSRPGLTVETHTTKPPTDSYSPSSILTKKTGFTPHPTTILGLQAVLATGLAMIVAYLMKMDSPNLVFWTAFVVIAGSTGESLRRITMRVAGVIIVRLHTTAVSLRYLARSVSENVLATYLRLFIANFRNSSPY